MSGSRRQAGFSLVEVMIAVAIIGILAAIGIPSLNKMMPRVKLANNTRTLANEISSLEKTLVAHRAGIRTIILPANNSADLESWEGRT